MKSQMWVNEGVKDALIELLSRCVVDGVDKLCTGALLRRSEGLLLVRRAQCDDFLPGLYEMPGGGMEPGETILGCLQREVQEETSVAITHVDAVCSSFDYRNSSAEKVRQFNFVIRGDGEIHLEAREHDMLLFVNDETELANLSMSDESRRIVVEALHLV